LILATKNKHNHQNNKSTGRITRKKEQEKKEQNLHFSSAFFFVKPYILCVAGLISLEARSLRFCHSWKRCRSQQKVGVAALTKQRWVR
jgi:hypothetical protein